MKLGDKVKINRYIAKHWWDNDEEVTKQFAIDHDLKYRYDYSHYAKKAFLKLDWCPWYGFKLKEAQEGIIVGVRTIKGYVNHDIDGKIRVQGKPIQVYLVATGMKGFYRVPKKWIDKEKSK